MQTPLRPPHHFPRSVVFDVKPMTASVCLMPLPLAGLGFLDSGLPGGGGGGVDGEEELHEGVVGVVVGCPFAVDEGGEGGGGGAFF